MYHFNMHELDVLKSAVNCYGLEAQLNQLTEECGELIAAVNHFRRGRACGRAELVEEMADVYIMIEQIIFGVDCSAGFDSCISRKIVRLDGRLQKQFEC